MFDTQIEQATCRITCGEESGTGWLVSSSHVITARHCIADAIDGDVRIELRFEIEGVAQDVAATVLADDQSLDACVLLLEQEVQLEPIVLEMSLPAEGSRFSSFGFPVAKLSVGHRLEGSISQVLDNPKLSIDLDLQVEPPGVLSDYKGISGAALICDGRCWGMLRIAIDKSLGAISIARIAEFLRESSIPLDDMPSDSANDCVLAPREEFTQAFDSLISTMAGGYAFIEGAHGIGKSTFCETYQPSISTLEHFGTYSFTSQANSTNSMHLAQPEVFFDWLNTFVSSHLTGKPGRVSEKRYPELITQTQQLLEMLAEAYSSQGKIGIIFVDGLDEVAKLSQESLEKFVGLLPSAMPAGLALILSAPSYVNLSAALGPRVTTQSCITMPGLEREASLAFCADALLPERASATTSRIICDKAQGHALYLRYLIDLANGGSDDEQLAALPLITGSIRNYYEALWPQLLADPEAINLLAIIARLRWGIPFEQLADILNDAEKSVLVPTLSRIQHLLLHRDETAIYHLSFTDFLIEKTTIREQEIQHRLTDYCLNHPETRYGLLNTIHHGLRSGQAEESRAVVNCTQEWVDRCVTSGANPDVLLGDVDEVLAAASKQGNLVEVVRILLLTHRVQFRYDTLFALSADLAVDALVALGKTNEALQHAVRYGHLIIHPSQALRLALQFIETDELKAALSILDKVDAVLERQFSNAELTIGSFLMIFELQVQVRLLQARAGDKTAWPALQNFYGWSINTIRNSVEDKQVSEDCLLEISSFFSSNLACLVGRYTSLSKLREYYSGSTGFLEQLLLQLLANYRFLCTYFDVAHSPRLLSAVFSDIETLLDEKNQDEVHPSLDIIDSIVLLGAPSAVIHRLTNPTTDLAPLQFVASDNINLDMDSFASGMAQWRLRSLLDTDLPCPVTVEIQCSEWRAGVESICCVLAWCDGTARRTTEAGDATGLHSVWSILEKRVFEQLRFTLAQRSKWNDCYALPEAVFPEIYERLTGLIVEFFPEHLSHLLSFIEEQFEVQCGLYSEGFRSILAKVIKRLAKQTREEKVEDQTYALLKRWRHFTQSNVTNRHELVPELLAMIPLFVQLKAAEEAHLTYQAVLSFSMGPSWYKEDQLSLMTDTLQAVCQEEALEHGMLSRVAGCLEAASGEMTFQRFVRYDKAELLGFLCQRGDYLKATQYFMRQSCGTAEQLLAEATESELDRIAPLRGMRFPGGAIDEQDALYRMLDVATPVADWPINWALLEIYQFGDVRHLEKSAKSYARLIVQAREEPGASEVMLERLKIICAEEFDGEQRQKFLSILQDSLPQDLIESFKDILKEKSQITGEASANKRPDTTSQPHLSEESRIDETEQEESALNSFVMPGVFGTQASSREAEAALERAERQLTRGNILAARTEALKVLELYQHGGWSIWGNLSPVASRAEAILRHEAASADIIIKAYAPLITAERNVEKWRRAAHLIEKTADVVTTEDKVKLISLVVEHVETIIGETAVTSHEYQFLEEPPIEGKASNLFELILAAADHPLWLRQAKASEMLLWLLNKHTQYIPIVGPLAFTMASSNLPDILCGALDHVSMKDAIHLWDQLAPALDISNIQHDCKHTGRLALLLCIIERAAQKGSENALLALEQLDKVFPQPGSESNFVVPTQAQCPKWALICKREWQELTTMGLATNELVERATTVLQETCAPLSIETTIELEGLLAEGFSANANHPLGRWKAKTRHALQVALLPFVSKSLLPHVTQTFRVYNPSRLAHLRILDFSSPSLDWLARLSSGRGGFEPACGNDVYLDFLEFVWDGDRYRSIRMTMFFYESDRRPDPPTPIAEFFATQLPTSKKVSGAQACIRVADSRTAFFGSFTPAIPSDLFMQMTNAKSSDLTRAHWRIGRTPPTRGGGPFQEGCFLAINRSALRLPKGFRIAWVCEIDGQKHGVIS